MADPQSITPDTLLAKLAPSMINNIIQKLQFNENWRRAAAAFTRRDMKSLMFDYMQIELLQQHGTRAAKQMFNCLLPEMYTLQRFLDVMIETKLFFIADYITVEILHGEPVSQNLAINQNEDSSVKGDYLQYDSSRVDFMQLEGATCGESSDSRTIAIDSPMDGELRQFRHHHLQLITDCFNEIPMSNGGRLIGEGGYGLVFYGEDGDLKLAIKRLHTNNQQAFLTEIKTMAGLQHQNILELLGYSDDRDSSCLVYPYMSNGSLEHCLVGKDKSRRLSVAQRLDIAIGLAQGMHYLHTRNPVLIHRDIKSANVLLDDKFVPKLGDFGIVRICPTISESHSATIVKVIKGTRVYIAPETFQSGRLSPKSDIYSFGVILYELLTGLKACNEEREYCSLTELIVEECDGSLCAMLEMVDQKVAGWTEAVVDCLFSLGQRCVEFSTSKRPDLSTVIQELQCAVQKHQSAD